LQSIRDYGDNQKCLSVEGDFQGDATTELCKCGDVEYFAAERSDIKTAAYTKSAADIKLATTFQKRRGETFLQSLVSR
jgi:hypothetical protein